MSYRFDPTAFDFDASVVRYRADLLAVLAGLFALLGLGRDGSGTVPEVVSRSIWRRVWEGLRPLEAAVRRLVFVVVRGRALPVVTPRAPSSASRAEASSDPSPRGFALYDPRVSTKRRGKKRRRRAASPSHDDTVSAAALAARLRAVLVVLCDPEARAVRMLSRMGRHRMGAVPMRPGRPPGYRKARRRVVHVLLDELSQVAAWAGMVPRSASGA